MIILVIYSFASFIPPGPRFQFTPGPFGMGEIAGAMRLRRPSGAVSPSAKPRGHTVRTAPNGASLTQPAPKPTKRTSERNKIEASVFGSINEKISSMV